MGISSFSPAHLIPTSYTTRRSFHSVNGSSIDGNCSRDHYVTSSSFRTCNLPTSSVLFDGNIPTLTGLDGDVWASQLLTIQKLASHHQDATIEFHFSPIRLHHAERIEVVAFNCPEWGHLLKPFESQMVVVKLESSMSPASLPVIR